MAAMQEPPHITRGGLWRVWRGDKAKFFLVYNLQQLCIVKIELFWILNQLKSCSVTLKKIRLYQSFITVVQASDDQVSQRGSFNNRYVLTGVLGGVWPCGIITLLDELYIAESKSQVYGSIHNLLWSNPSHTENISRLNLLAAQYNV